jgi:hypothetical protein
VHELAVRYADGPAGRVDAHNPQSAVIALLVFPANVGELESAFDGFLRRSVQFALG